MTTFAGNGVVIQKQLVEGQGRILGNHGVRQKKWGACLLGCSRFLTYAGGRGERGGAGGGRTATVFLEVGGGRRARGMRPLQATAAKRSVIVMGLSGAPLCLSWPSA